MALTTPAFKLVALCMTCSGNTKIDTYQLANDKKYLMTASWLLLFPFSISSFHSTSIFCFFKIIFFSGHEPWILGSQEFSAFLIHTLLQLVPWIATEMPTSAWATEWEVAQNDVIDRDREMTWDMHVKVWQLYSISSIPCCKIMMIQCYLQCQYPRLSS